MKRPANKITRHLLAIRTALRAALRRYDRQCDQILQAPNPSQQE